MMPFNFDTPIDRLSSPHDDSLKWGRYPHQSGQSILPMWVADMDFAAPPAVIEALRERVAHGVFGYPHVSAEVQEAVLLHLARDLGWHVEPEWLVWLPGLVTGLNVCCRAVGESGDAVVTATPIYPPFMSAPKLSDRQLLTVPLTTAHGAWVWDLEALAAATNARTRLLMLCNPHNPVGRVWRKDELEGLAAMAERHDWIICSDDIHCELLLEPGVRYTPIATLSPEIARRTITLLAPSKTYNIPGLGAAFAVIPDAALRRRFERVIAGIVPHINVLGYTAMAAAYRHGVPWRDAVLDYLRGNRDQLTSALNKVPGLKLQTPEATYLAWIDASGLDLPVGQSAARFFEAAGVGLSPGESFLPGATDHVRLNFGCTRATLDEAIRRITKACMR
ncbi:MAG: hypothetical protein RIQ55_732 [Pseudomonadota bacterium]|jgi:cystathionine beta-lyase